MQLALFKVFSISSWKFQVNINFKDHMAMGGISTLLLFRDLSSRTKLLLILLASMSLGMLAAGVVLRQRRRKYRAKSLSYMGVAMSRQNTFGGRSSVASSNRSLASHQRVDSFPEVYIIDGDDMDGNGNRVLVGDTSSRVSVDMSIMEYDNLIVNRNEEVFLSLSQNMSTEVETKYFDITPELDSLITSYPSMVSPGGVTQDYLSISDSDDSFESAIESLQSNDRNKFYLSALLLAEEGNIKCRIMRTTVLGCSSDRDFLAKLFCIRQAFDYLLVSEDNRSYAINAGKELIISLLNVTNSDTEPFVTRYTEILQFVEDQSNWSVAQQELKDRGVACLNIYDVALDFMLMDAFDDLSSPPSALLSVIQNGWISDGIKQSMLNTAVWSILKAKKSVLKNKNGFMSKFYLLSETMSPVFAWGFLGTNVVLKERCLKFKSEMMSLIRSMFSLQDANYSNIDTLSDDILRLTRQTVNSLSEN